MSNQYMWKLQNTNLFWFQFLSYSFRKYSSASEIIFFIPTLFLSWQCALISKLVIIVAYVWIYLTWILLVPNLASSNLVSFSSVDMLVIFVSWPQNLNKAKLEITPNYSK